MFFAPTIIALVFVGAALGGGHVIVKTYVASVPCLFMPNPFACEDEISDGNTKGLSKDDGAKGVNKDNGSSKCSGAEDRNINTLLSDPILSAQFKITPDGRRICYNCCLPEPTRELYKRCKLCIEENSLEQKYYCSRKCQAADWKKGHRYDHMKAPVKGKS